MKQAAIDRNNYNDFATKDNGAGRKMSEPIKSRNEASAIQAINS
jgi:hypothetical protein